MTGIWILKFEYWSLFEFCYLFFGIYTTVVVSLCRLYLPDPVIHVYPQSEVLFEHEFQTHFDQVVGHCIGFKEGAFDHGAEEMFIMQELVGPAVEGAFPVAEIFFEMRGAVEEEFELVLAVLEAVDAGQLVVKVVQEVDLEGPGILQADDGFVLQTKRVVLLEIGFPGGFDEFGEKMFP